MNKIIVDIYGADSGPTPILAGIAKALHADLDFFPILVGDANLINTTMTSLGIFPSQYEIVNTTAYIKQTDPPTCVFGGRDDSSMVLSLEKLKHDDDSIAMLSAGNTGALFVGSICRLGLLKGFKCPTLLCALPSLQPDQLLCLIDCGANMECTASDLAKFAELGSIFCSCYCGIESPRVGIMSVGRERGKGNSLVKEAFNIISGMQLNFVGNLEGGDMVSGYADVIVCDGFSGNILLKNTEAAGKETLNILNRYKDRIDPKVYNAIAEDIYLRFDFNAQGAAVFMGTRKPIIKMHGCANENTTISSIQQILKLHTSGYPSVIAKKFSN